MDSQEATLYTAILISSVVIGIIIVYFVVSIVRQQRRNLDLHRQNILAEITTLEGERSRLSSDIHDELGPLLSFIRYQVDGVESANSADSEQLKNACLHLDEALDRMRAIARNLMPTTLTRKGFAQALAEYVENLRTISPVNIYLDLQSGTPLETTQSVNLFRILQEIIQNCLRHARASHLAIQIFETNQELLLRCEDDGIGFNYSKTAQSTSGLGLRNIQSRVEIMNGKLEVDDRPGGGTRYLITLPIQKK